MSMFKKLKLSNKAHRRLLDFYSDESYYATNKNYSSKKIFWINVKKNYHSNILRLQNEQKSIMSRKDKKKIFNTCVEIETNETIKWNALENRNEYYPKKRK